MTTEPLEQRIDTLEQEVHGLKDRLEGLTRQLSLIEMSPEQAPSGKPSPQASFEDDDNSAIPDIDSDKLWSWVGKSALLPKIAAICFIMVFALILRTMTDNNVIGMQPGSYLGMGYAAFLIGWGVRLLSQKSKLATVFPVCGVLLMYSIVLESHVRFDSITSLSVYLILFGLLIITSSVGIRFKHIGLTTLSIFGTCLVASLIDFPKPYFAPLIFLLLSGNILAFLSAKKLDKGEWNRLVVFILTVTVWLLWTFRLRVPLAKEMIIEPYLSQGWFFPAIIFFSTILVAMSTYVALRKKSTLLDLMFPVLNILWAYPMSLVIVRAGGTSLSTFAYIGIFFAILHFGLAAYLFKKYQDKTKEVCGFTLAGLILLMLASPLAIGSTLLTLLLWSIMAYMLARISKAVSVGGLRLLSYLMQGAVCIAALIYGDFFTSAPQPVFALIIAGVIAGLSGHQFFWCRKEPLVTETGFFGSFDRSDRSAIVLLAASLVSGYSMLHLSSFLALSAFSADPVNALKGMQSILINGGAISMLLLAMRNRNKEILTTAVVLIIIGAFKVFGYDLFRSNGIPLVLSVLSFGGVAAVGSVVLSRWSRN